MKKLILIVIISIFISALIQAQGCLPDGIIFGYQVEIDNFQLNYPGCTEIEGDVTIWGEDVVNLDGLNVLNAFGGSLKIGIGSILYGTSQINLSGLENVTFINGDFVIEVNLDLISLTGIENIAYIGGNLSIYYNPLLSTCEFESICNYLANPNGSVSIEGNDTGCNNQEEVEEACLVLINEINSEDKFTISPNPIETTTQIEHNLNTDSPVTIQILDISGQVIKTLVNETQQKGKLEVVFDGTELKAGIYFCVLKTNEGIQTKKIIKL